MSGCPTRDITKKLYKLQELLAGGNRHDTGGGRNVHALEVCEVRFQLPKTDDNNKTHKNDADTLP